MNEAFRYITPITYGLIVAIWLYVFVFYIRKIKQYQKQDKLLSLLLIILIIDAFRTIFEGLYFGLRHTAHEGFIPVKIFHILSVPQFVFLPKIITFATGLLILTLLLYKWLPTELKQKMAIQDLINKKNSELLLKNQELTKAKDRAEESDRLKTEFLRNLSHEIRTPMNGIIGFSEMLDNPDISSNKRTYYSKIIQNSSHQLLRIIDDILEISNLETKQERLYETQFCLNDFLMELFSVFNLKFNETEIAFGVNKGLDDYNCHISTDKTKLNRILSNLLENAFRYTTRGYVELGYRITENKLVFYVQDTGIGISKENHESVFERFSQEEKEISQKYGGLGLGLAISRENAKLLGGDITLKSEKGKGSTFYVTIPFNPVQASISDNIKQVTIEAEIKDSFTVLVAEDEEVNYLYIEALLKQATHCKYNLIHAVNGKEAVDLCDGNKEIDIVLMDIKMPVMNGHDATEKIRSKFPDLPIIAQTAYSTESDKELALKFGCNDFISKPLNKEKLISLINKYLTAK